MKLSPSAIRLLLSNKARAHIYEALSMHMDNGLHLPTTLRLLRTHTPKGLWAQESLLDIAVERMEAGATLGTAFRGSVPDLEFMLLMAGDCTGKQAETLRRVASLVRTQSKVLGAVWTALGYPLFLLLLFVGLLITVALFVIPAFLSVVELSRWREYALLLHDVSMFVASWKGAALGGGLFLLVCLALYSLPRWSGALRRMVEQVPPWSLYRLFASSMWLFTLATMLRSGIRMAEALDMTMTTTTSSWLRQHLGVIHEHYSGGEDLGQALLYADSSFFEKDLKDEISVYATLPNFAEKLPLLAEQWLQWRVEQIEKACRKLNIVGILCIFSLLMLVALAIQDLVGMLTEGISLP